MSHLSQLERNFVVPQFGPGVLAKEDKWVKVTCLQGTIRVKLNFQRQDWSLVLSSSLLVIITVWHFVTLARSGVGATIPKADMESGFPEVLDISIYIHIHLHILAINKASNYEQLLSPRLN